MRVVLLFCFFAICISGCISHRGNPKLQTVTLVDRNGMTETVNNPERIKQYQEVNFLSPQPYEKVICIHARTRQGDIPSFLHSYHENGLPKQFLEVINSRAFGLYTEWHPNGTLKAQATVIGGEADLSDHAESSWIFDGHSFAWDEEGCLQADILYEKGFLHGDSIYYHPNGHIWRLVPHYEGQIHGTVEVFLNDGTLFQTSEYVLGKLDGRAVRYWNSHQIATEEFYQGNALLEGKYFDRNGALVCEVRDGCGTKSLFGKKDLAELHEFKNGNPEGLVKIYGTDGKLLLRYHVKNQLKHGEEVEFYEEPHLRHLPKLLVTWYEGKIQGTAKTWYDNGVQESNREMSNNQKTGVSTAWYRDGTLMLIEEYQQGKLIKGEYYRRGEKNPISVVKDGNGIVTLFDAEGNFVNKITYQRGEPIGA